ncbi:hypothetical protein GZH47_29400 [Paenibacillus rhizovicinus]|uniref:Uncharacterized protein n=1 Tax=Paenibacillus rhizovicinus TaxID=2704463 RepID=A0A6C0P7Z8_9BACL|nr:hypothetical protein [Paenibacillus rhizovicinus]QHW34505.1 hypothetical protein GZH47_29400 [Paenibacillus rhizovicinus]
MGGKSNARSGTIRIPGYILSRVASMMIPLYSKIARNQSFALRWSKAVRQGDLDTLIAMFKSVAPMAKYDSFSVNGIGYFIDFAFPEPIQQYSNGTTIPPGTTQFTFSTPINRAISRAVLPFYRKLARSTAYASALAEAINANHVSRVRCLIRQQVTTKALKTIEVRFSGVELNFKYTSSTFAYRNLLFREIVG